MIKSRKAVTTTKRCAVFIDRDGVLNEMVYDCNHGIVDSPRLPNQVHVAKGAGKFIRTLQNNNILAIVVTNQPGIAKGTLSLSGLKRVNDRLATLLKKDAASWDALYYCPHHVSGTRPSLAKYVRKCGCRKPKPGMLLRAARDLGIDLQHSWMIGDGIVDVQAGKAAGCRTILVTKVKIDLLDRFVQLKQQLPDFVAASLDDALNIILPGE